MTLNGQRSYLSTFSAFDLDPSSERNLSLVSEKVQPKVGQIEQNARPSQSPGSRNLIAKFNLAKNKLYQNDHL